MPRWEDAVEIAEGLPGTEVADWYRTPALKVKGKGFARLRSEAEGGLVVMCEIETKELLLESGDPAFYTTPHYDGYGAILVNLAKVKKRALRELLTQAWRMKAPRTLLRELDEGAPARKKAGARSKKAGRAAKR